MGYATPHLEAFSNARSSATSIYEVIDRKSKIDSMSSEGIKVDSISGEIKFENVHFQYPSRKTIKVLSHRKINS